MSKNYRQACWLVFSSAMLLFVAGCGGSSNSDPVINTDADDDQETIAVYSTTPISGLVGLNVSFDASGSSGNIVEYQWDFGDGSTASGATASHTYNQAGTYITSLTVTDNAGVVTSASHSVYVFDSIDNDQVIVPNSVTFYDAFDYLAGRDDSTVVSIFQSHGWANVKTQQAPETGNPRGYMYTTDTIPDFSGPFPGASSSHVLAMEALPSTYATLQRNDPNNRIAITSIVRSGTTCTITLAEAHDYQWTTSHLIIEGANEPEFNGLHLTTVVDATTLTFEETSGSTPAATGNMTAIYIFWGRVQSTINIRYGGTTDAIPADVWFQFWVYPTGGYDRGMKFIYPCNASYPCHDLHWLFTTGTASKVPLMIENGAPGADQFMNIVSTGGVNTNTDQWNEWKLGQQDGTEQLFQNRWTLVKLHLDTSTSQGSYEAWLKPIGGPWVKVAEWIGGVTPGFTWPIPNPSGHRQFVMPGTVGGPLALDPLLDFDSITYLDDFAMAESEDALPQYPY